MTDYFPTDRCCVCGQRITMRGWEPFCCEVCFDSDDAMERRLEEAGAYGDLWVPHPPSRVAGGSPIGGAGAVGKGLYRPSW